MAPQNATFVKFHEFSKMVQKEDGTHEVWGISTLQQPDSDNELCDYETAVPVYQAWSSKAFKRTSGNGQEASLGNIRVQHGSQVGGKATRLEFKDDAKEIWLGSEPIDDAMVTALLKGFYTGYSQGGSYAWRACSVCEGPMPMEQGANYCKACKTVVPVLYGLKKISEVSYVDSPAIGIGFQSVKANGSVELVKFQAKKEITVAKTKTVASVALPAHCFAYVGDPEKTETWKLPIEFPGNEEKTKTHIRNALARFDQTRGIPADKKEEVKAKIHAAATAHGIDVTSEGTKNAAHREKIDTILKAHIEKTALAKGVTIEKSLYDVARCAEILMALTNLWECSVWELEIEGDESDVPDELRELLDGMVETFIAMATEEAKELAAKKTEQSTGEKTMTTEELQKQKDDAEKAAKKSLASHFAKAANHHEKMADHHEAAAEHHEALETMHKTAHEGMKKANVNTEGEAEPKGSEVVDVAAEFHKSAGAEHGKIAGRHTKMAKAHDAMAEHCDKMGAACDEDEAKKVAKELKDSDAALAKADPEPTKLSPEDEFTRAAIKKANDDLLKDPEFQKEVKDRQRALLLGKLAESGAAAIAAETIAPTTVKGGAATATGALVERATAAKYEFAKEGGAAETSPGF